VHDLLVSFGSHSFWIGVQLWVLWLFMAIALDSLGKVSRIVDRNRDLILGLARAIWQLPLSLGMLLFLITSCIG
jgi:hypothetical protein